MLPVRSLTNAPREEDAGAEIKISRLTCIPMVRILIAVVCLLALRLPALGQDSDAEQARRIGGLIERIGILMCARPSLGEEDAMT